MGQKETPQDIDKAKNATQLWEEIKTTIQKGIQRNYPIQHNAKQETPEWAREAKKWSSTKEWEDFQRHLTERKQLQAAISKLDKKTKQTEKQIATYKIFKAWQQAAQYMKERTQDIKYATSPEPRTQETHKTNKKRQQQKIQTYKDTITIKNQEHSFQTHQIQTKRDPYSINIIKKYRDIIRRRKNKLRQKYVQHGQICALQNKWRNKKLQHETNELMKAAE